MPEEKRKFFRDIWEDERPVDIPDIVYRAARTCFNDIMYGRNLFMSARGYLGLGPIHLRAGDYVFILLGGMTPYIVRSVADDSFASSGECCLHGIMNGEAMEGLEGKSLRSFRFV